MKKLFWAPIIIAGLLIPVGGLIDVRYFNQNALVSTGDWRFRTAESAAEYLTFLMGVFYVIAVHKIEQVKMSLERDRRQQAL